AVAEDVKSELHIQASARQSKAPHFVDYVLGQLEKTFGSPAIQQGGLVVHTTLDLDVQQNAEQAVTAGVADLHWANVNNAALLAANPKTGEILAWVGSADYSNDAIGGQFDVVLSRRQPGSSFKPYVYEAALRDHTITWATILHDQLTNFNGYTPRDFDNGGMGDISASTAILYSRNIPAVQVAQMEGINNVITLAHAMGVTDELQPYLSTAIGASDITLYEHVQGYATFANQGQRVELNSVREVDDAHGTAIYKRDQAHPTMVLTPAEAYLMTDVLQHYQYMWGFGWHRQMASKTGTSDNGKGGIPDSWIMAYNPDVAAGVWVGNTAPNGGGGLIRAFGESVGQTIMRRFVNSLPAAWHNWYTQPQGVDMGCGGLDAQDPFLPGSTCPSPSPTPSPASSARTSPSPKPTPKP
ncbi:MAG TPA: penicillin-binding transpeptidase domain-containing protein, partial [Candidatus Dormibacteraeota bacterium]|nr:penicillin-binding transpeptidase domain-containing protein [Candidatus Dormibacteraeota bacterium]